MELLWLAAITALLVIALTTVINTLTFPRIGGEGKNPAGWTPRVSVLIPARNEVNRIVPVIEKLLAQDYPDYEIIILDDNSTDDTGAAVHQAARGDARLRVLPGAPLPAGWLGKNWACHQLSEHAQGEVLVFTDADVHWAPGALSSVVGWMARTRAGMFTVWPTQQAHTPAERLVVPMMLFVILGYLPELAVRRLPWAAFSAANGQCLAFRRATYEAVGGHAAVRGSVIEDVSLAQAAKRAGGRLVMALGDRLVTTRMYTSWGEARDGFAKNILAGHAGSPLFLAISAVFHWLLFLIPWVWLPVALAAGWDFRTPLALVGLGLSVRLLGAAASHHRLVDALLLPLSVLLFTAIAARALYWHYLKGGAVWKGRVIGG